MNKTQFCFVGGSRELKVTDGRTDGRADAASRAVHRERGEAKVAFRPSFARSLARSQGGAAGAENVRRRRLCVRQTGEQCARAHARTSTLKAIETQDTEETILRERLAVPLLLPE